MLHCLEYKIIIPIQIEELLPVADRKIVPLDNPHSETNFFGIAQRIHEGLDSEIISDSITLDRSALSTDIDGVAFSIFSGHGEPHLAQTECRKIDLFREAKCSTVAVFIMDVDKSLSPIKGQSLEPHPMVLCTKRAFISVEIDIHIPLPLYNFPVMVNDLMRIFRRLIDFAADVKGQLPCSAQFPVCARLDIGMERYNIAPVRRNI